MKIEQLTSAAAVTVRGTHPLNSAYFDGYYFTVSTPTSDYSNYTIYRSGLNLGIYNTVSADMTTYGIMMPFMKVLDGPMKKEL